ncbi:unnamed protein product [Dicrocoelium dendriticum]|nr:unnamed protein product [Dicrocoelium dendriticum]
MLIASLRFYLLIVLLGHSLVNLCAASGSAAPGNLSEGHRRIRLGRPLVRQEPQLTGRKVGLPILRFR